MMRRRRLCVRWERKLPRCSCITLRPGVAWLGTRTAAGAISTTTTVLVSLRLGSRARTTLAFAKFHIRHDTQAEARSGVVAVRLATYVRDVS
ncbi:hypothetical protein BD309DRAFT_971356 [Dichomitus squalens]|uniref:Uncharacterized protein n=1 Tax=Dichomitus squalens TaxID=114155 RepID=A0A4Q9PXM8_9APHY|nr:hypothetical protein BD309DRAFT_971356 [Dichomitus squalens]TBU59493.1 hypothetical protein BD310DRAFT_924801 [Dichomitus squalens]